jgi:hypothetical protein
MVPDMLPVIAAAGLSSAGAGRLLHTPATDRLSSDPAGITQEIYALLTVYQALRIAITDTPGHRPRPGSFTIALQAAREQVMQAAGT